MQEIQTLVYFIVSLEGALGLVRNERRDREGAVDDSSQRSAAWHDLDHTKNDMNALVGAIVALRERALAELSGPDCCDAHFQQALSVLIEGCAMLDTAQRDMSSVASTPSREAEHFRPLLHEFKGGQDANSRLERVSVGKRSMSRDRVDTLNAEGRQTSNTLIRILVIFLVVGGAALFLIPFMVYMMRGDDYLDEDDEGRAESSKSSDFEDIHREANAHKANQSHKAHNGHKSSSRKNDASHTLHHDPSSSGKKRDEPGEHSSDVEGSEPVQQHQESSHSRYGRNRNHHG